MNNIIPHNSQWSTFFATWRSLSELWDIKSEDYKNRSKKEFAWQKLLKAYHKIDANANLRQLKKRIYNIRTCFQRELKKVEIVGNDSYVPKLWYFKTLEMFLCVPELVSVSINNSSEERSAVNQGARCEVDEAKILAEHWAQSYRKLNLKQQDLVKKGINVIFELSQNYLYESDNVDLDVKPIITKEFISDTDSVASVKRQPTTCSWPAIPTTVANLPKEQKPVKQPEKKRQKKNFYCEHCQKHFGDLSNFKVHIRRHWGLKLHQCQCCGQKFHTTTELRNHTNIHTGIRPFACVYCPKTFSDRSTKSRHERIHLKDSRSVCTQCDETFSTPSLLKIHMYKHRRQQLHKCNICNRTFNRQSNLSSHFRTQLHQQNEQKYRVSKKQSD